MAGIIPVLIDEGKIKLAWREKYVTDGANERALAHPRGAYRGYWVFPRLVADTVLRLQIDPYTPPHHVDEDQFAVYANRDRGFAVSVRETMDVEIDCAALFPPMGLPADETWYVYIVADYSAYNTTTAHYRVENTDPHDIAQLNYDPYAVILCAIPMPMGSTIFPDFALWPLAGMYERRSLPSPTARQTPGDLVEGDEFWGLLDSVSKWCLGTGAASGEDVRSFAEPTVETYAGLVGVTQFQLSGLYFVGTGAVGTAAKHFRLLHSTATQNAPLLGSDAGLLRVGDVYQTDGITLLTPSADADAEGFYEDPWVEISFAATVDVAFTGTLRLLCYKKQTLLTLDNAPAGAFPVGDIEVVGHAVQVAARAAAGTPSALAGGVLETQLAALLGFINDRIRTIHPTAAPADWVLLWRSHNVTLDANVTKGTCSIYWHNTQGLAILVGGYIEAGGLTVRAGTGAAAFTTLAFFLRGGTSSGAIICASKIAASPTTWDIVTGWDSTFGVGNNYSVLGGTPLRWNLDTGDDVHHQIQPMAADASEMGLYEQATPLGAGIPRFRRYMSQYGTYFASNCSWDPSVGVSGLWTRDLAGFDAIKVKIYPFGMIVCKKHLDETAVPWADDDWTTEWKIGQTSGAGPESFSCMEVDGDTYEEVKFGWALLAPFTMGAPGVQTACQGVTWHSHYATTPSTINVFIDSESENPPGNPDWSTGSVLATLPDEWGCHVQAVSKIRTWTQGDVLWCHGHLTVED
ncbi:MAG: hypothetical protein WC683_01550 [bacterium]